MWQKFSKKLTTNLHKQLTKANTLPTKKASPDELLGELFHDVQLLGLHTDNKTFTDLVPASALRKILRAYEKERHDPKFDIEKFVAHYFKHLQPGHTYSTDGGLSPQEHIRVLWNVLTRETYQNKGSLVALPYPYVVPGGRFSEQFYWDSYFIMLGLVVHDRDDLIEGMMKNYAYMIRKNGYIPTGNRTYFLSRSQPPFFSHMVKLWAARKGKLMLAAYLPYMLAEYTFWMRGKRHLGKSTSAYKRVVKMPDGSILNRYFDAKHTPRPESYRVDVEVARRAEGRINSQVYLDLRAACESGWDFSSRWLKDGKDLSTIHTTQLVPVDLNCLLYDLELAIADAYSYLKQPFLARRYRKKAAERRAAIQKYCWSEEEGFYFDYDFVAEKPTERYSLAATFPLFSGVADQKQAQFVKNILKHRFLKKGGLLTTLNDTRHQWDAPNGWAPLQWVAIQGLRAYGFHDFANEVKRRWIYANTVTFNAERKMIEKYNVMHPEIKGGGGEYALQDGFGWTNGVLSALLHEDELE